MANFDLILPPNSSLVLKYKICEPRDLRLSNPSVTGSNPVGRTTLVYATVNFNVYLTKDLHGE